MAETIANKQPKAEFPNALSRIFSRAIKARQKAAEWFKESHENTIFEESNQTHVHFIEILEQAAAILRPLVKDPRSQKPTRKERQQKSTPISTQGITNVFSRLAVEDTEVLDDTDDLPTHTASPYDEPLDSLPPVNPVHIQQDEAEIEAEFFFAIQSFITNAHEIRDIVQETWFEYKDGKVTSIKASLIANTAIDLVRHAESGFDLLLKRPKKYPAKTFPVWSLPALLFLHHHPGFLEVDEIQEFCLPSGIMIPKSQNCSHVYWCLWPVYSGLKSCFDPVDGAYEDAWRTTELARKFRHVTTRYELLISMDEIIRGMAYAFKRATQVETPFEELHDFLDRETAAIESFHDSWSLPFKNGKIVTDEYKLLMRELKSAKVCAADTCCDIMKEKPIRCGLLRYDAYLQIRDSMLYLEQRTGQICMMAHLYMATKLLHPESPDSDRIFFGGSPKTLDKCHRKAHLMVGKSAQHSAINPRQKGKKQGIDKHMKHTGGRWIQETSIIAPVFIERTTWAVTDEDVDNQVKLRSPNEQDRLARKLGMKPETLAYNLHAGRWRPYLEEQMNNENGPTALLRDLSMWLDGDACGEVWNRLSLNPGLGKTLGKTNADDPTFAAPLQKIQPNEAVDLSIFAVGDERNYWNTRGGGLCLTRLADLFKHFAHIMTTSLDCNIATTYKQWP
ncbi:hypothetical protein CC86DRAFT_437299 [Ophiobolus disseminans]|uniref:DUF6604 domain-containing protein n=1 Tax=Ophiobolus disseminans TaxID=1469910 RepID=A0A6A7A884_9PLEO|nr:hypothetical protein CC86DRAFT_437299 [Ophiobolus disseminans]